MGSPNHRIGSIILSLLLPAHLDAQLASPLPADPGLPAAVILGTVSDEHTRSPVDGVLVTARDNRSERLTAVTGTGGKFEILVTRPGMYSLETERIGYHSSSPRSVNVGVGDTAEVHVVLSPTPMLLDSLLVVGTAQVRGVRATEQLIHGKLLDFATRAPIPDAAIQLLGPDRTAVTAVLTTPMGLFRIVVPIPGTYRLRAERIGYRAAHGPAMHLMLGDTLRIELPSRKRHWSSIPSL